MRGFIKNKKIALLLALAVATEVYICSGSGETYKCEKIQDEEDLIDQPIKEYESISDQSSFDFLHLEQILFPEKDAN